MYYRDDVPKLLLVGRRRAGAVVLFIDESFQPLHPIQGTMSNS